MKKTSKFVISILIVAIAFGTTLLPLKTSAVSNPYPTSQTISGVTTIPCTYYAWQQAYDNTGIAMPNFGNAKNWYIGAKNAGYSTGTTAKAKSIAVWTNSGYGHVAYVVSVNGSKMTVNEGGMLNTNGTAYNGNGIINGSVCNSAVGSNKSSYSSSVLVGFIYLTENVSSSVSISTQSSKNTITDTNAILWGRVDKPSSYAVTKIGIKIRKNGSTYSDGWSKYEAPSKSYTGYSYMEPYYNMNDELGLKLTHATKYYYKIFAVVNGTEYWSKEATFTTTGSHSYGSWSTTKSATCTASGTKTRKCKGCSKTETQTIASLGHNYPTSYTVDKDATCTIAGSKSKHCSRCSATTSVTAISAKGHSYGSWSVSKAATCIVKGSKVRVCSVCDNKDIQTISALGHDYASVWTTDIKATCTKAGSKSHHCSRCSATKDTTAISSLGHSWSAWKVTKEATEKNIGEKMRKCTRAGCTAKETATIAKLAEDGHTHSFGEWETMSNATCTASGLSQRKCTECEQAESKNIAAVGHKFSDWIIVTEATEKADGLSEHICSACGEKEEKIIPKIINDTLSVEEVANDSEVENNAEEKQTFDIKDLIFTALCTIVICALIVMAIIRYKKGR